MTTHGTIGLSDFTLRPANPTQTGAPSKTDDAPARIPPSGKTPTTRPIFRRPKAARKEAKSPMDRFTGNAHSQRMSQALHRLRYNSSMAIQSMKRGNQHPNIGGSKWLMWLVTTINGPLG